MKEKTMKSFFLKHLLIISICISGLSVRSQDVQFSQFYAASMFTNPAFAGSGHYGRAIFHHRLQWPKLDAKFQTTLVSFDKYFEKYQSGIGGYLFHDTQGNGQINTKEVAAQYSYELPLNEDFAFRFGIQASVTNRTIDYSNLLFAYQYDNDGQISTDNGLGDKDNVWFPDFATGGLLYSSNMWFAYAVHHLALPNQSFIKGQARLPRRYSFSAGYKISLDGKKPGINDSYDKEISISPTMHYKFQGKSDQLDVGVYVSYDHFIGGLWYRGLPVKRYENIQNNESFIVMVGWKKYKSFEVRYSYDFTTSTLRKASPGGAHEISIAILLRRSNRQKPMKRLPCPSHHIIKSYKFS